MSHSAISLGLGLGGGKSATSSGSPGGGGGRAPFIPNARSVLFDGANDFFKLDSTIPFTGAFTISFWIKPVSGNTGFIASGVSGSSGQYLDWYGAAYSNQLHSTIGYIAGGANTLQAGNWYNVLLVRDASNGVKAYQQGVQVGSDTSFSGTVDFQWFGARRISDTSGSTFLNGYLDEIALWDSDQTSNRAAIYNSGVAGDLWEVSPPLHWYRMGDINGGSGADIADIGSAADAGGAVDGELWNTPTYSTDVPS